MLAPPITQKAINKLALPAMISGLAEPLIGLADTAILGNLEKGSTAALGGVGLAVSLFFLFFWTFVVLHPAMVATVGRYLGKDKVETLDGLLFQLVIFNLLLGGLVWLGSSTWASELLTLYNAKGDVLTNGVDYFQIRVMGFPLMLVTYLFFGVFQGLQNTRWAMWIALMGGGLNLVLSVLLVYGVDGLIPALGVKGAAWGALGSQVLMLGVTLFFLLKKTPYRLRPVWKLHSEFWATLKMGANFMLRTLSINAVLFISSRTAASFGEAQLAAHSMAFQIWTFSFFLLDGFSMAGQAMSGKLLGERSFEQLRWLSKRLLLIGGGLTVVLVCIYWVGYGFIGHVFSNDIAAVAQFESFFWLLVLTLPLSTPAFTYDGLLKGMGEARFLRNMMVVAACMYALTVLVLPSSLQAVWWGFVAWMSLRTFWPGLYFRRKLKKLEMA